MKSHRVTWTAERTAILRRDYPHTLTSRIADALGVPLKSVYMKAKHLGLRKTPAYLASDDACRLRRGDGVGMAWRFGPDHRPWNAGTIGASGLHPNTAAHHFGPGNRPHTWKPVGSLRVNADGYLQRKLTDTGYAPRDWVALHRSIWEAAHGAVPAGSVVVFRPGKKTTVEAEITLDAVECITRAENMQRNSVHANYPPEIARLVQLRGALARQINRKARQAGARPTESPESPTP